jgi:hypothetical protein
LLAPSANSFTSPQLAQTPQELQEITVRQAGFMFAIAVIALTAAAFFLERL